MTPVQSIAALVVILMAAGAATRLVWILREGNKPETAEQLINHPRTCRVCRRGSSSVMCGPELARRAVFVKLVFEDNPPYWSPGWVALDAWDTNPEVRARWVSHCQFLIDGVAR